VADEIAIDAGQYDRFEVATANPVYQRLDRGVEIEDQNCARERLVSRRA
jgi:hypothetical protein